MADWVLKWDTPRQGAVMIALYVESFFFINSEVNPRQQVVDYNAYSSKTANIYSSAEATAERVRSRYDQASALTIVEYQQAYLNDIGPGGTFTRNQLARSYSIGVYCQLADEANRVSEAYVELHDSSTGIGVNRYDLETIILQVNPGAT